MKTKITLLISHKLGIVVYTNIQTGDIYLNYSTQSLKIGSAMDSTFNYFDTVSTSLINAYHTFKQAHLTMLSPNRLTHLVDDITLPHRLTLPSNYNLEPLTTLLKNTDIVNLFIDRITSGMYLGHIDYHPLFTLLAHYHHLTPLLLCPMMYFLSDPCRINKVLDFLQEINIGGRFDVFKRQLKTIYLDNISRLPQIFTVFISHIGNLGTYNRADALASFQRNRAHYRREVILNMSVPNISRLSGRLHNMVTTIESWWTSLDNLARFAFDRLEGRVSRIPHIWLRFPHYVADIINRFNVDILPLTNLDPNTFTNIFNTLHRRFINIYNFFQSDHVSVYRDNWDWYYFNYRSLYRALRNLERSIRRLRAFLATTLQAARRR